jgi:hypothetical protein
LNKGEGLGPRDPARHFSFLAPAMSFAFLKFTPTDAKVHSNVSISDATGSRQLKVPYTEQTGLQYVAQLLAQAKQHQWHVSKLSAIGDVYNLILLQHNEIGQTMNWIQ